MHDVIDLSQRLGGSRHVHWQQADDDSPVRRPSSATWSRSTSAVASIDLTVRVEDINDTDFQADSPHNGLDLAISYLVYAPRARSQILDTRTARRSQSKLLTRSYVVCVGISHHSGDTTGLRFGPILDLVDLFGRPKSLSSKLSPRGVPRRLQACGLLESRDVRNAAAA